MVTTPGDAEGPGEELASQEGRAPLFNADAYAVAALGLSFLSASAFTLVNLLAVTLRRLDMASGGSREPVLFAGPMALIAALGVFLGLLSLRRSDDGPPWSRAVAGGGVIIGVVVMLITIAGMVLALIGTGGGT